MTSQISSTQGSRLPPNCFGASPNTLVFYPYGSIHTIPHQAPLFSSSFILVGPHLSAVASSARQHYQNAPLAPSFREGSRQINSPLRAPPPPACPTCTCANSLTIRARDPLIPPLPKLQLGWPGPGNSAQLSPGSFYPRACPHRFLDSRPD